jgi:hypothetical protein
LQYHRLLLHLAINIYFPSEQVLKGRPRAPHIQGFLKKGNAPFKQNTLIQSIGWRDLEDVLGESAWRILTEVG